MSLTLFERPGLFDQEQERRLLNELLRLRRNEAVMSYYQLQGFLFAMQCSPEQVLPSQWFDLIWLTDEPQFDDEAAATGFFRSLVALSEYIAASVRQRRYLPFSQCFHQDMQPQLSEWCEGFLMGHHYLDDVWMVALDDLDDEPLEDSLADVLALATHFADLGDEMQLLLDRELAPDQQEMADAYQQLSQKLAVYAGVSSRWQRQPWAFDINQLFLALESVPADESCPCGSGKTFAKCCLH